MARWGSGRIAKNSSTWWRSTRAQPTESIHPSAWKVNSANFACKRCVLGRSYQSYGTVPTLNYEETVPLMLDFWKAPDRRSYEDRLLLKYWREVGGVLFTEVPIGRDGPRQWPPGAKPRRIDDVRIVAPKPSLPDGMYTYSRRENYRTVEDLKSGARVEVIEVKRSLNALCLDK